MKYIELTNNNILYKIHYNFNKIYTYPGGYRVSIINSTYKKLKNGVILNNFQLERIIERELEKPLV